MSNCDTNSGLSAYFLYSSFDEYVQAFVLALNELKNNDNKATILSNVSKTFEKANIIQFG